MKINKFFSAVMLIAAVALASCGGNDNPPIPDQGGQGGQGGEVTPTEDVITVAKALEIINALDNAGQTDVEYSIQGTIKVVTKAADVESGKYNNLNLNLTDATGTLYCVFTNGLNNEPVTSASQIPADGTELILKGKLKKYVKDDKVTPEMVNGYIVKIVKEGQGSTEPSGDVKDITIAQAIEIANKLEASAKTTENYRITATLTKVQTADEKVAEYGNINITVKDETGEIACYYTNNVGNQKFTSASEVPAIGSVLKIVGPLKLYVNKNTGATTPEFENAWIEEVVSQGSGPADPVDGGEVTVAQFLEKEDSDNVWYTLTGTVGTLKDGDQYGNFDLTDETGTVYVYGLTKDKKVDHKNDKSFQSLGIKAGDMITISGTKTTYKGNPEVNCAYLVAKID